jgi:hypothetical protein
MTWSPQSCKHGSVDRSDCRECWLARALEETRILRPAMQHAIRRLLVDAPVGALNWASSVRRGLEDAVERTTRWGR